MTIALPFRLTAEFVLNNERVSLVVASDTLNPRPHVSFTGSIEGGTGGGGQIDGTLREHVAKLADPSAAQEIIDICDAWDALHLKRFDELDADQLDLLEAVNLDLLLVNGERYGAAGDLEDIEDADFSNSEDFIDSRDIVTRIELLKGAFEAAGLDPVKLDPASPDYDAQGLEEGAAAHDVAAELKILTDLESEGAGYASDWGSGATLIRESYFVTYAQELLQDIGDLPRDLPSYLVIDWEATANNIRADYTEIDYDGVTYLVR